jgi:integrase/recombinase XerD
MSDRRDTQRTDEQLAQLADAFDRDTDPLAQYGEIFEASGIDPFELFTTDVLETHGLNSDTIRNYRCAFRQWREHMADYDRHPACPSVEHVRAFVRHLRDERDNHPNTVKMKLRHLNSAYEYWQDEPAFPHPTDFNPFSAARQKVNLDAPQSKDPPRIPVEQLREILGDVTHVRDRAVINPPTQARSSAGRAMQHQIGGREPEQ